METMPTIENAAAWLNAHTATNHLDVDVDVVDRQAEDVTSTRPYSESEADYLL